MGKYFIDQFTYLHFAVGIVAYFWSISLNNWILINIIFELFENSDFGIKVVSNIPYWPGSKPKSDTPINIVGDIGSIILGWLSAYYIDKLGIKYGWYNLNPEKII
tara:strand:- start:666 stop:980 length:315 start_codon:yes stop_codon:yes gene_type:complete